MKKNRFYLVNVMTVAIILAGMMMISNCASLVINLSEISIADESALTQEVFADNVRGKSDITFTTTEAWTSSISTAPRSLMLPITNSSDWISISPISGDAGTQTISITLEKNTTGVDRKAIITISCNRDAIEIKVTQKGVTENGETLEEQSDFVIDEHGVLTKYIGTGGDIVIPEGVREIADQVFISNSTITSVKIPASVITIGNEAFGFCDNLIAVTFSEKSNLKTIGNMAFTYNSGITSIEIPASVVTIGNNAFWNCNNLTSLTFVKNSVLQTIQNGAFRWTNITSIDIPASVKEIGNNAFENCRKLLTVTFPDNCKIEKINPGVFQSSGLTSISIPTSITEIGNRAFENCRNLSTIIFSKKSNLQTINWQAFYNTGIKSIEFPASLSTIGQSAFEESGLSTIIFAKEGSLKTIGAKAFQFCGFIRAIEIPASVVEISEYAFSGCGYLTTFTFAANSSLQSIGNGVFAYSPGITSLSIPASVTTLGSFAFGECKVLTNITFAKNSSLHTIGNQAFYLSGITSIDIPRSTMVIGDQAFMFCVDLKNITVHWTNPKTLTYGKEIFYGLKSKTNLYVPTGTADLYKNNPVWSEFNIVESSTSGM